MSCFVHRAHCAEMTATVIDHFNPRRLPPPAARPPRAALISSDSHPVARLLPLQTPADPQLHHVSAIEPRRPRSRAASHRGRGRCAPQILAEGGVVMGESTGIVPDDLTSSRSLELVAAGTSRSAALTRPACNFSTSAVHRINRAPSQAQRSRAIVSRCLIGVDNRPVALGSRRSRAGIARAKIHWQSYSGELNQASR